MNVFRRILLAILFAGLCTSAQAQQEVWLQIEAQPTLSEAQDRASTYARRLENVAGFQLGSTSWYAIVLGPYGPQQAEDVRARLRRQGLIPSDSFTTDGQGFRDQFWPIGGSRVSRDTGGSQTQQLQSQQSQPQQSRPQEAAQRQEDTAPDFETVAEARQSERALTNDEQRELQEAMRWSGVYDGPIDALFGQGTRSAMAEWQRRRGYEATGVLTTRQREELLSDYYAVFDGLGMELVRDEEAGIAIAMPTALVSFDRYVPPFAHYEPQDGEEPVKVLLISQRGDRDTLRGLFDIMQTLEIVPPEGPRQQSGDSFSLTGRGQDIVSHTEASLQNGQIKGFTLIWPADDEDRRARVLDRMRESFRRMPGVLPDEMGEPGADQRIDLVSGLQIRRPDLSRSGFYVDGDGAVLTTSDVLRQCRRITLNDDIEAEIAATDDTSGLALLRPRQTLAPLAYARLHTDIPRLQSRVAVSGYSYEGVLGAPTLTYGTVADLRGLSGEDSVNRLDIAPQPGDAGGPVLSESGSVMGMLLPRASEDGKVLPDRVSFAADVETIAGFLSDQGLPARASDRGEGLNPDQLTRLAADMTVLVSCWN
ncbi:serine protease [Tranquillimonas alkanivorans]|uniref:Putative peptidoglycan binding domain-containing protein n=1 Tax=Tranquillimonas alkanivorans TaxID=441119 RepID=A0A1I5KJY3_9RHOB|nr:serine protease [Tranquillimonas alkanivorans]SFO85345.1 Putative peptidoglycan binding domain-containing protein [Tranquillimonas alkanivorans]